MAHDLQIRREKREALISNVPFPAKRSHLAVPAKTCVAAVLHKCGSFAMHRCHLLQMLKGDIAYAQLVCTPCVALLGHGLPDLGINFSPAITGSRSMQHEAVNVLSPKMFERTGQRF